MKRYTNQASNVVISYYQGACGPTIRIDTQDKNDLQLIQQVFEDLAAGRATEIDLGASIGAKMNGLRSIKLSVAMHSALKPISVFRSFASWVFFSCAAASNTATQGFG